MNHLLSTSTAANALSNTPTKKLFKLNYAGYSGRLLALYLSSPSDLQLTFADPPYTAWSTPIAIASDVGDSPFDAVLSDDGTLWVAYTTNTNALVTRKLTFAGGTWTVASPVTVYSADQSHNPSVVREATGKLWISWSLLAAPNHIVHVKSSTDNGATWGTGPSDSGEALTSGATFAYSKLMVGFTALHVIATYGNSKIIHRSLDLSGGLWSDEFVVATAASGFMDHFDSALGPDGMFALLWSDTQLRFREFDGLAWGAIVTVSAQSQASPQLVYRNNIPVVTWLENFSGFQKKMMYSERRTGTFSTPKPLDLRYTELNSLLLYSQTAGTYANLTAAAASATTADIFHNTSTCMLKSTGDAFFAGMDQRFRYLHVQLSTIGSGGTVNYSYWDGSSWKAFTPASGISHLDAPEIRLHLWTDHQTIPADWQKKTIAGQGCFWIKCEVTGDYATGPIGSRLTAIPETSQLIIRR